MEAPESMLVYDTSVVDNTADVDGGGVLMVSVLNGTADFVRSPIRNNTVCVPAGLPGRQQLAGGKQRECMRGG